MARGDDRGRNNDEEKDDKDATVSDEALELLDEDEEDDPLMADEVTDDKGWE